MGIRAVFFYGFYTLLPVVKNKKIGVSEARRQTHKDKKI